MNKVWKLRAVCFFMCFCLEVKVKASFLEEPLNCLSMEAQDCAISPHQNSELFSADGLEISIAKNSILKRTKNWKPLSGSFWVKKLNQKTIIALGVGEIQALTDQAQLLIEVDPKKALWVLRVLEGEVLFADKTQISEGFELEVRGLNSRGQMQTDIPKPFPIRRVAEALAQHRFSNKKEFVIYLSQLRTTYSTAVSLASQSYQVAAQRQIASVEEQRRQRAQRLEAEAKERAALIKLFRQKNFLDL